MMTIDRFKLPLLVRVLKKAYHLCIYTVSSKVLKVRMSRVEMHATLACNVAVFWLTFCFLYAVYIVKMLDLT